MERRLAIIPARAGSKRIINKNSLLFNGSPMVEWVLRAVKSSKLFDLIHVSTNSKEVLDIAISNNIKPDFMRPEKLCDENTGLVDVIDFVSNEYKSKNKLFDEIWCILPCNPMLSKSDLIEAGKELKDLKEKEKSAKILSVIPFRTPPQWAYIISSKKKLLPLYPEFHKYRSQDLNKSFIDSGTFAIYTSDLIYERKSDSIEFAPFIMDPNRFVDIDYPEDLELLKTLNGIS
tara:strand:+ start:3010 stop:3705 length:696 start_codon:yes stop_codon:yes gene_type:complete